jgi:hypothetical protein
MNSPVVNRKLAKIILLLATIPFVWLGAFGLIRHAGEMKSDMTASGCLFDGGQEVCAMNIGEHVAIWQNMFMGIPQTADFLQLVLIALAIIAIAFIYRNTVFQFLERVAMRSRLYLLNSQPIHFFDSLREAFSRGIINSKIYASVAI